MANQTVSVNRNLDDAAISGLINSDVVTISDGAVLTINSDNRWSQQAAIPEDLTISTTTGGEVLVDGRDVWEIAFDASTGNVPTLTTLGSNGVTGGTSGATGEFLAVFTALGVNPSAAASAMPAAGFIKLRSKTGTFVDNEIITLPGGATVTVNSTTGGKRSWLSVVMEDGSSTEIIVPRLGAFRTRGDWYYLGETNGADDQTFQFPVQDRCPAIQVETSPGSGVYEWWLNGGDVWGSATVRISQDVRGKFFGDTTAGVITIALRAANACGFKPASGCKVRIPNVILSGCISPYTALAVNTTIGNRPEFTTTSAGVIDIEYACSNWYFNFVNAYSLTISSSCWADNCIITEPASPVTINNCAATFYTINGQLLSVSTAYAGGSVTDCRFCRHDSSGSSVQAITFDDVANWTLTRVRAEQLSNTTAVTRGTNSSRCIQVNRSDTVTFTDCVVVGGGFVCQNSQNITYTNTVYCDLHNSSTSSTNNVACFAGSGSVNISVNGFSNLDVPGVETHPYLGVVSHPQAKNLKVRNIGTSGSPYDAARSSSANGCATFVVGGNVRDCKVQRCYGVRFRTAVVTDNNEDQGWTVANVQGDYADSRIVNGTNRLSHGIGEGVNTTNASSSFGTHWMDYFTSATQGAVQIRANEPTAVSATQCSYTGTTRFDGAGGASMPTLNDSITWTTPRRILGHTGFQNVAPTLTGTNTGNFTFEYQIDTGSGYGAWTALSAANLSAETISPTTGFLLKIRATVSVAAATNLLQRILIPTNTTASDQLTLYPLNNPDVGYTGTMSGSVLSIWDDSSSALLASGSHSGGNTLAQPDWDSDYTAVLRLRKPGYTEATYTGTVDEDGFTIPATQTDTSIADTDPGALGITITNHGASPVSWQSKSWSITITTTNDALTAAQVANWINYNISQIATWNGFVGHAWPTMIEPDGSGFKTTRGRLFGSLGAALKGVRVVRNDGTTAVVGFTTMQADDGTTYTVPTVNTWSISGYTTGSRIQVYNVDTATEIYNDIPGASPLTGTYTEGTDFTTGDSVRVRIAYQSGVVANVEEEYTAVAGATGWQVVDDVETDAVYGAYGVDGSTCTEFAWDGANLQIDINDSNNTTEIQRVGAWYHYYITTADGIANVFGGIKWDKINEVLIDAAIVNMKLDNTKATPLLLTGGRIYRSDGTTVIAAASGSIHIDYDPVYAITTGTSGLTPSESALLADIAPIKAKTDAMTVTGGNVLSDIKAVNGYTVTGTGVEPNTWGPA